MQRGARAHISLVVEVVIRRGLEATGSLGDFRSVRLCGAGSRNVQVNNVLINTQKATNTTNVRLLLLCDPGCGGGVFGVGGGLNLGSSLQISELAWGLVLGSGG